MSISAIPSYMMSVYVPSAGTAEKVEQKYPADEDMVYIVNL